MSRALAHRVYCRIEGTPAEALVRLARRDPRVRVGRLGDAVLLYPGPDIPWCAAIGLGLDETPADALVPALDAFFDPKHVRPELLITPYTRSEVLHAIAAGGYRVTGFRHLLIARRPLGDPRPVAGLEIVEAPANEVIARGFADGAAPRAVDLALEAAFAEPATVTTFRATIDGAPVGGGRVAVHGGIGLLFGASVRSGFRRRGVHSALLARRVAFARGLGADVVIVESTAGHGTARNALRLGFEVAFTNAVFRRT